MHAPHIRFVGDDALTTRQLHRRRALAALWEGEATPAVTEPPACGQEKMLAIIDWSLRLAGRMHLAASGQAAE